MTWRTSEKIAIVACGTAYHAGIVGKYYLEQLARILGGGGCCF